ncbi:hypothetical protein BSK59_13265 [Paenibacillus odorifer]|uniref:AbiTii domain-containing protein n=1 Tax=Paenibacillus odorifer TaxID=189426 RepID=UPI00096CFDE9|nr:hypothetical protein [Paenibacillus odorifer]OME55441.1 hypothetical protein BSK59_13265 [Paenibacillus odorifer]
MGKSQLLKDLVSGSISLENILLRLKIILSDLENETIMEWINGELEGYGEEAELPKYRVLTGVPMGTFIVNGRVQYTESQVPVESLLTLQQVEELKTVHLYDSVSTLQLISNSDREGKYGKQISTYECHYISKPHLQIASMHVVIPSNQITGIVFKVKSKLLDVIMELEKRFTNLDELDIKSQIQNNETKEQIVNNIGQIIYEGTIEIGDKNKIKSSGIGKLFKGGKQ